MIKDLIGDLVALMVSNDATYSFQFAERDFMNITADDEPLPCVYLEMPISYKTKVSTTGFREKTYIGVALILFKSELGSSPEEDNEVFEKAENAERELELLLDASEDIKSFTIGDVTQVLHLFDCDVSGVLMPFTVTPYVFESNCLPTPEP